MPQSVAPETWARVQPVFEQIVVRAVQRNPKPYYRHSLVRILGHHLVWCESVGIPLVPAEVLRPHVVDRYLLSRTDLATASITNIRSILGRADDALVLRPPRASFGNGRSPAPPYTDAELSALRRWVLSLPPRATTTGLDAVLALAAGAGFRTASMRHLRGSHIARRGRYVVVHDPENRDHPVAVLAAWEDLVLAAAERAGDDYIVNPGWPDRASPHLVAALIQSAGRAQGDVPRFDPYRLHTTWLCHHLAAGTPPVVLMRAAGMRRQSSLDRYAALVPWPGDEAAFGWLRG